jgi:hypothetical protein
VTDLADFWQIRAQAIQEYATLEQCLCRLFSFASDTRADVAGVIFFKMGAGMRNGILDKLLRKKFERMTFWTSFLTRVRRIDETRNKIVHWNVIVHTDAQRGTSETKLIVPNIYDYTLADTQELTRDGILEFMRECSFLSRLVNNFQSWINRSSMPWRWTEERAQTWSHIFQQEVVFPPPDSHPLCQTTEEPENPPPASPE